MAQRGGVVESAILFGDGQSTIISDGEADILVGFEPAETLRAMNKCNSNTVVITNLSPLPPFTVAIGKGEYPDLTELQDLIRARTAKLIAIDAVRLAKEAGNAMSVNMVLLGALIQTDTLPLPAEAVKEAIRTSTKQAFVETNLKAFNLGFAAAQAA
jgi:indolepyruvate ferredoxin oxidoreductase beta subunit